MTPDPEVPAGVRPGIAIITVTFNARDAFRHTVRSIRPFRDRIREYIVIDGASRDGTRDAIATEDVVTSWISEPDGGIYDAMNKGWRLADLSSHIMFLGAGDTLLSLPPPEELDSRAILFGDVELEGRGLFESRADRRLLLGNTLHHQALLVPKAVHPAPPFDLRFPTYADYDFNLRLFRGGVPFRRSAALRARAAAGGVSHHLNPTEMSGVVTKNLGPIFGLFSRWYLGYQQLRRRKTPR